MACLITCASGAVCYSAFACTRRFGNRLCVMCSSVLLACFTSTLIVVETPAQLYAAMAAIGSATGFIISSSFALALEHIPHNELESLR
jgi:MFS family permease